MPLTLLIRRSLVPKRAFGARFFDCLVSILIGFIQQNGIKKFTLANVSPSNSSGDILKLRVHPHVPTCYHSCWM